MHIDEDKKFDKRNIVRNIKNGVITQKDYDTFVSKLPDVSNKSFNLEEASFGEAESREVNDASSKKKGMKKRARGKGK